MIPGSSYRFAAAILRAAVSSPPDAMRLLSSEIERQLRLMLASTGMLQRYRGSPIEAVNLIAETVGASGFPESLRTTIRDFYVLRDDLTLQSKFEQRTVLSFVNLGLFLLEVLRTTPRRSYVVLHNAVQIFSDSEARNLRPDVHGVMLWTIGPVGETEGFKVFATKRNYAAGTTVSWEWDLQGPGWSESWYRDPMTNSINYAWSGGLEFIGRPLEEV